MSAQTGVTSEVEVAGSFHVSVVCADGDGDGDGDAARYVVVHPRPELERGTATPSRRPAAGRPSTWPCGLERRPPRPGGGGGGCGCDPAPYLAYGSPVMPGLEVSYTARAHARRLVGRRMRVSGELRGGDRPGGVRLRPRRRSPAPPRWRRARTSPPAVRRRGRRRDPGAGRGAASPRRIAAPGGGLRLVPGAAGAALAGWRLGAGPGPRAATGRLCRRRTHGARTGHDRRPPRGAWRRLGVS